MHAESAVCGYAVGESMKSIPLDSEFVKRGLACAMSSTLCGRRFEDMSREELLAAAAMGWRKYTELLADKINPGLIVEDKR